MTARILWKQEQLNHFKQSKLVREGTQRRFKESVSVRQIWIHMAPQYVDVAFSFSGFVIHKLLLYV